MCGHCGCDAEVAPSIEIAETAPRQILSLQQNVLAKNNRYATQNRAMFRHLLALNILSSPGAGKTTLIQRLLRDRHLESGADPLQPGSSAMRPGVIVGDLASDRDAERLRQTGLPAIWITTGNGNH